MFESMDVVVVVVVVVFFYVRWRRGAVDCTRSQRCIPGPVAVPVVGTAWVFYLGRFSFNRLHEYYEELHVKYGSVVKEESLGNVPVVSLFDGGDIVKVLKSGGKFPLRPPSEAIAQYRRSRPDRYASVGLVNEQGELWHLLRASLTPALTSPKTISDFMPQISQISDDWCNLLKHLRDSHNRIDDVNLISDRLGLEITCALVLGRRMGFLLPGGESDTGKQLAQAVRDHFLATRDTYFGLPLWKLFPTSAYKHLVHSEERIYELALDLIDSADDSIKESAVFQSVLKAEIDDREKIAAIVDFISAGIHTMKNSLLFLLHLVGGNDNVQKKLVEDEDGSYSKACLTESFRLYPTANPLARILNQEMDLGGFRLEAGSVVLCHNATACRSSNNFPQPNDFQPERWLVQDGNSQSNASLILSPFGAGSRICPGKRLIEHILPAILTATIQTFSVVTQNELELQFEFLLAPKGKVPMVFNDRV